MCYTLNTHGRRPRDEFAPGAEREFHVSSTEERRGRPGESCTPLVTEADMSDAGSELKAACKALRGEIQALERSLKIWLITAAVIQAVLNALIRHVILFGV